MNISIILVVLILIYLHLLDHSESKRHSKIPNICTRVEQFQKEIPIVKTKRIKEKYHTFCFALPPRCTKYTWKTVSVTETVSVNSTRTVYDCCKGYENKHGSCVPVCKDGCGHGECVEPEVCLCDEGWRAPYCLDECEPNRYGRGCRDNCTCRNGATCDKKNGLCYCTEGYIGKYCEYTCPSSFYGINCSELCKCENGGMCDIKDGTCDCGPGYFGEYCEEMCDSGNHGMNCEEECICLPETTTSCHHETGECICDPGYTGEACEEECSNFTYGFNCSHICKCSPHTNFCDPVDGTCICTDGWIGDTCSETCPPGTYGATCELRCATCPNASATCNPLTGFCDCPLGSFGDLCEKSCIEGYWGSNCTLKCDCMTTETCDGVTGNCTCNEGWIRKNCSESCDLGYYGQNCASKCSCTKERVCNSTTGNCNDSDLTDDAVSSSRLSDKAIFTYATLGILGIFISCLLVCLFFCTKKRMEKYRNIILRRSKNGANGTSTDEIFSAGITNPMYECSEDPHITNPSPREGIIFRYSCPAIIAGQASSEDIRHTESTGTVFTGAGVSNPTYDVREELQSNISVQRDGMTFRYSCPVVTGEQVSKNDDKESDETELKKTLCLMGLIKTSSGKSKLKKKQVSPVTSESGHSRFSTAIDSIENYVPESLCEFDILEENIYDEIKRADKGMPSSQ